MSMQNKDYVSSKERVLILSPRITTQTLMIDDKEITIKKQLGVRVSIHFPTSTKIEDKTILTKIKNLGLLKEI